MPVPSGPRAAQSSVPSSLVGDSAPQFPANPPFFLVHFRDAPQSWEVVDIDDVPTRVPCVAPWRAVPGVLGMRTLSAEEQRNTPKKAFEATDRLLSDRNVLVIDTDADVPADLLPAGVGPGAVIRKHDVRGGGFHHTLFCDVPRSAISGRQFQAKHHRDEWNKFRAYLVTSGQIPAPSEQVIEDGISAANSRAAQLRSAAKKVPDADERAEMHAQAKAHIDRATNAVLPGEAPKPTKAKRAKPDEV